MRSYLKTIAVLSLSLAAQSQAGDAIGSKAPAITPASPTGYEEVLPHLNANGAVLSFYDTRQAVSSLQSTLSGLSSLMGSSNESEIVFRVLEQIVDLSGIESVAAVGASSVPRTPELAYNRMYVRFKPGSPNTGAIWNLFGTKSQKFDLLEALPETTAGAYFTFLDLGWLDKAITKVATESGKQAELDSWKKECEQATGLAWNDLLQGLGDQVLIFLTLSPSETISVPIPGSPMALPYPAIALVLKPKGEAIYQTISKQLTSAGLKEETAEGVTYFSQPVPNPTVKGLSPTVAKAGGLLVIGSTKEIALGVPAVAGGKGNRLTSTAEFKSLSEDAATEGNSFTYVNSTLTKSLTELFENAMNQIPAPQGAQIRPLIPFYTSFMIPRPAYSVMGRNGEDWLITGNGPEGNPMQATTQPAILSMLAAIAVPNFLRARERSQATTVLNDARMLDAAVDQYAIEQNKQVSDPVTFQDIREYLKRGSRLETSGGRDLFNNQYIITTVGGGVKVNPATIQKFSTQVVPTSFWDHYR